MLDINEYLDNIEQYMSKPHFLVMTASKAINHTSNIDYVYKKFPNKSVKEVNHILNGMIRKIIIDMRQDSESSIDEKLVIYYLINGYSMYEIIMKSNLDLPEIEKYINDFYKKIIDVVESFHPVIVSNLSKGENDGIY